MKLKNIFNMKLSICSISLYLRKIGLLFIYLCLIFLSTETLYADVNDSLTISKQNWRKTVGETDFTETYTETQTNSKFNFKPSLGWIKSDLTRNIFTVIVLGILVFLLYLLLRNKVFNFDKKITNKELYQVFDENADISNLDLDSIFSKVMLEQNYRLAIRIRFLMVLKVLVSQEYLRWEKDKTNGDYIRELSKTNLILDFKHLVFIFERIWFSDVEINASDFSILNPSFTNFISKLKENEQ